MRILLAEALAGMLLCGLCLSQNTTPAPADSSALNAQQMPARSTESGQTREPSRIAPGSVIPVQLTKTVDAKKAKTGDAVDAKVTQDLKAVSGEIVMPKDTKVVGHITEAEARSKEQKESKIGIAFDQAIMKDGSVASLPMSIQAVIATPSQHSENENAGGGGAPTNSAPGAGFPPNGAGRSSGTGMGAPQPRPGSYPAGDELPNGRSGESNARQSITANTQGMVEIPNYTLTTSGGTGQGSVVSSEKGNVKLETGTIMLLRVNQ